METINYKTKIERLTHIMFEKTKKDTNIDKLNLYSFKSLSDLSVNTMFSTIEDIEISDMSSKNNRIKNIILHINFYTDITDITKTDLFIYKFIDNMTGNYTDNIKNSNKKLYILHNNKGNMLDKGKYYRNTITTDKNKQYNTTFLSLEYIVYDKED